MGKLTLKIEQTDQEAFLLRLMEERGFDGGVRVNFEMIGARQDPAEQREEQLGVDRLGG